MKQSLKSIVFPGLATGNPFPVKIFCVKNMGYLFLMIAGMFAPFFTSNAQNLFAGYEHFFQERRNYVAGRTTETITIDGKADEPSWKNAAWTEDFVDIEGDKKPVPLYRTRMKMLWDDTCLYIFAQMDEPHVWAYFDQRDQIVYHENDFEVFLDPDGDTHNYFEIEINARNTIFDLFLTRPYYDGGVPLISWNAPGFRSAVNIEGTINDPSDTDFYWSVEMAVPFSCLYLRLTDRPPLDGQQWKVNFSRVQWKSKVVSGKYEKLKDEKTGLPFREDNWVWSPTGEINLHVPERWGMLQFSDNPVTSKLPEFSVPAEENLKKYLWLIYYKQESYKLDNGSYAPTLAEISIPENLTGGAGEEFSLSMEATSVQFTAFLSTTGNRVYSIDNQGFITEIKTKATP